MNLVLDQRHHIVNKIVLWKDFASFQIYSISTRIINEWTGVAVLCCHGQASSYIPTSKMMRVAITKIF